MDFLNVFFYRCCKVCARVEGEPCGGLFGFSGSCAVGLQCVIKNLRPPDELDEGICSSKYFVFINKTNKHVDFIERNYILKILY